MASSLKAKYEEEAKKQKQEANKGTKQEPTGVAALVKTHKNHIDPPPPKVN